jgi:hypothetical protein
MTRMTRLGVVLLFGALGGCVAEGPLTATPDFQAAAPPEPQHIWVHYDYMVFPDGIDLTGYLPPAMCARYQCVFPPGFSTAPDARQIDSLIDIFRDHGIALHIDRQHTAIPGHVAILNDMLGFPYYYPYCWPDGVLFSDLKAQYFHPSSNHPWHYAIFGFAVATGLNPGDCTSSGVAVLSGFDFIIAPGYSYITGILGRSPHWFDGMLMHELGHNLGLRHGGDEEENYKPNYLSVMNYLFNFGIPQAMLPLNALYTGPLRLDYSDRALPTLDMSHLDENAGIGIPSGTSDWTLFSNYFGTAGVCPGEFGGFVSVPAQGPIDWNCNGVLESDVANAISIADILTLNPVLRPLRGFDDWAAIRKILTVPPSRLKPGIAEDRVPDIPGKARE